MWNTILTVVFFLLGGIVIVIVSFIVGWNANRITTEKMLDDEITNLRDEYANTEGDEPHDYCIMIRTVREIKKLI